MNENRNNASEKIDSYKEKGYKTDFRVVKGKLLDYGENSYSPDQIKIVKKHRFEGMTNPSDMSLLYVIETTDGNKGTILVPYGNANDTEALEFFNKVPEENIL